MQTLYDYLYKEEMKRGEEESASLRFYILGILLLSVLFTKQYVIVIPLLITAICNGLYLKYARTREPGLFAFIILMTEIMIPGLLRCIYPESISAVYLWILYLILLYSASLRLKEKQLLIATALVISIVNLDYLLFLIPELEKTALSIQDWPNLSIQILMTLLFLSFTFSLLNRAHMMKRILSSQQKFLNLTEQENAHLVPVLKSFSREFGLSARESEVLSILIKGKTYRMIAGDLYISLDTVKSHIKSIYRKSNTNCRSELLELLKSKALAGQEQSE